jgi:hypothetical protein
VDLLKNVSPQGEKCHQEADKNQQENKVPLNPEESSDDVRQPTVVDLAFQRFSAHPSKIPSRNERVLIRQKTANSLKTCCTLLTASMV